MGDDGAACEQFADYLRVVRFDGRPPLSGEIDRVTRLILTVAQRADDAQLARMERGRETSDTLTSTQFP